MQQHVLAVFLRTHFLQLVFQSNVLKLVTGYRDQLKQFVYLLLQETDKQSTLIIFLLP